MPRDFLNRAARPAVKRTLSLFPDSLVVAAMKAGGEPELGMETITWPFEVLCGALRDEAQLHATGIIQARREVVALLATRGRVLREVADHPEIDGLPVPAPIVVTGIPGSGVDAVRDLLVGTDGLARPDQDDRLMGVHMTSMRFELDWHVPAYAEWYDEADLLDGYLWARRLLAAQQAGSTAAGSATNRRWVLTSVQHVEQLPALFAAFPDAIVVQCHRDLGAAVDVAAGVVTELRQRSSDEVNPGQISRYWRWRAERMLERNAAQRDAHESRIVDVDHHRIEAEPERVVAEILERAKG